MTTENTVLVLNLNLSPDATFHFSDQSEKLVIAKALAAKQITGRR